jgi:hypothetical protein
VGLVPDCFQSICEQIPQKAREKSVIVQFKPFFALHGTQVEAYSKAGKKVVLSHEGFFMSANAGYTVSQI